MSPFAKIRGLLSLSLAFGFVALAGGVLLTPSVMRADVAEPVTLTLSIAPRIYTGANVELNPETDFTISPGSAAEYTLKTTFAGRAFARNAGTYAVKMVATTKTAPFKTATATGTLVIGKAPLTVSANDQARLFGAANPALSLSYGGFVNGETFAVLDRRPVAATPAKTASPVGEYTITVSGGADNNYEITARNPGRFTVMPPFPGTFEALLPDPDAPTVPAGKLTLTLPARGNAFTGRLELASEKTAMPLSGRLAPDDGLTGADGSASRRGASGRTYRVDFNVSASGLTADITYRERGSTDDFPAAFASLEALATYTTADPSPAVGAYTFALLNPSASGSSSLTPGGLGHATAGIAANGVIKLAGKFADGSPLTASARSDADLRYRLFLRPYGSRLDSFASGEFTLEPHPDADRAARYYVPAALSQFYWKKAAKTSRPFDKLFPEGFEPINSQIALDPWLPPVKARAATRGSDAVEAITLAQRLGLAFDSETTGLAEIAYGAEDFGESEPELPVTLEFTLANKAAPILDEPPANPRAWKITSLNPANGRFAGSFKLLDNIAAPTNANPDRTVPKVRTVAFQGTLRQAPAEDPVIGAGYLILADRPDDFEPAIRSVEIKLLR